MFVPLHTMQQALAHKLLDIANVRVWCDSNETVKAGFDYVYIKLQKGGKRTMSIPNGRKTDVITEGFSTLVYDINTEEKVFNS